MKIASLLLLFLALAIPGTSRPAQDEETVLGKPSAIQPASGEQETVALEAGARLREQPRVDSPVVEILPVSLGLPVLDRHGPWVKVRFGSWQGWVRADGDGPETGEELRLSLAPDEDRLRHARSLLSFEAEPRPLGPFTLYTDVDDEELLTWLGAVTWDVLRAYRERFGLDPGSEAHEVLIVFADEANYRRFEAAEERIAKADSRGYTSQGLSLLFIGDHGRTSLVSVFIHELTHLLNRRVFRTEISPWLEEGMAEDLAFSQVTPRGQIRLGTLAGLQRQGIDDRYALSETRAHLAGLWRSWSSPKRPDLESLVIMDWAEFIKPDNRAINYAASAMLLRYFSDGGKPYLRHGFRRYLAAVSIAELPISLSLWESLGVGPEKVEEGLHRFVSSQARATGIR